MQPTVLPPALHFAFPYFLALAARLGIAYLLAIPIGYERGRDAQSAGLRTFPLVAVSSCAYVLLGVAMFEHAEDPIRVRACCRAS